MIALHRLLSLLSQEAGSEEEWGGRNANAIVSHHFFPNITQMGRQHTEGNISLRGTTHVFINGLFRC